MDGAQLSFRKAESNYASTNSIKMLTFYILVHLDITLLYFYQFGRTKWQMSIAFSWLFIYYLVRVSI